MDYNVFKFNLICVSFKRRIFLFQEQDPHLFWNIINVQTRFSEIRCVVFVWPRSTTLDFSRVINDKTSRENVILLSLPVCTFCTIASTLLENIWYFNFLIPVPASGQESTYLLSRGEINREWCKQQIRPMAKQMNKHKHNINM